MQRVTWTDERLDDLARRMDAGFDRVDRSFERVDEDFRELRGEIGNLRTEVRVEISDLRGTMNRFGAGMMLSMLGLIAAQALG
jgi:hypothetical protein